MVAAPPNYVGISRTHSGPWDYLQEVPLLFYGPGHVPRRGPVPDRATVADIAPTLAAHLGFDFAAPHGHALEAALPNPSAGPPRVAVVVVWDGGGRNVLARHPDAWPTLRRMIDRGVWFERATVATSPSVTAPVHATIGTGAYPSAHGRVGNQSFTPPRDPSGEPVGLLVPSLADAWDRDHGNLPVVGLIGLRTWHLGMMGDGAWGEGGDRDPVVLIDEETAAWDLLPRLQEPYRFPPYAASVPGLAQELQALDRADGNLDAAWRGETGLDDPATVIATPAFTRWQTRLLERFIPRERFGADALTDLLFLNIKQIDLVGHRWSMDSPQARDAVAASDQALAELAAMLDRFVGPEEWVLALTADHGSTPPARRTGAWVIDEVRLLADLRRRFDTDGDSRSVVARYSASQLWLDRGELADEGATAAEIAAFVRGYTIGQNARDPGSVPEDRRSTLLYQTAFPSSALNEGCPGPG